MRISIDLETLSIPALATIGEAMAEAANTSYGPARKLALLQVTAIIIELESREDCGPGIAEAVRGAMPPVRQGEQ